eukprot:TRINITY_DN2791_c0_g2_i1.p1 TRINITY_DN2791_c0_g2~~TRINITY_DN2791_c0_g2_i1.p1  ORF type:complete len:178 (+),score=58.42 TRINITY_DN2791_c0_g2_i1:1-534(+)
MLCATGSRLRHFSNAMSDASLDDGKSSDIFYVCKSAFVELQEKLKKNEAITEADVNRLTFPDDLPDDEIMTPVDMRGVGAEVDRVETMLEKMGPKGAVEAFIKASEYFEANVDKEEEEQRPKPITAKEWRQVLEETMEEGEEEEFWEEEEEEDGDVDGEAERAPEGGEPPAKKAKTE